MTTESGIYLIANKLNGYRYVGQTAHLDRRRSQWLRKGTQPNTLIGRAIRRHGFKNFSFVVLERCPIPLLDAREARHIAILRPEYNMGKPISYSRSKSALTAAEARRLKTFCSKNGGQEVVAVRWLTSSTRISRLIARVHAPQKAFRQELIKAGIIKEKVLA